MGFPAGRGDGRGGGVGARGAGFDDPASRAGGGMRRRPSPVPVALQRLLPRLAEIGVTREFYLAGGTGLALLLGHRRSVDLDFFSRTNRLAFEGRRDLLRRLRRLPDWALTEAKDGTLHGRVGMARVSFFWYPEPLVRPLIRQGPVRIASTADIGLMKIEAIIGRGSRKDFVDLFTVCQRIPLRRLLRLGSKKFRDSRDFTLQALKALCFFEDAEHDPPVVTPTPVAWDRVKAFFRSEVQALTRRYLTR